MRAPQGTSFTTSAIGGYSKNVHLWRNTLQTLNWLLSSCWTSRTMRNILLFLPPAQSKEFCDGTRNGPSSQYTMLSLNSLFLKWHWEADYSIWPFHVETTEECTLMGSVHISMVDFLWFQFQELCGVRLWMPRSQVSGRQTLTATDALEFLPQFGNSSWGISHNSFQPSGQTGQMKDYVNNN